jgi:hypothetical protein
MKAEMFAIALRTLMRLNELVSFVCASANAGMRTNANASAVGNARFIIGMCLKNDTYSYTPILAL